MDSFHSPLPDPYSLSLRTRTPRAEEGEQVGDVDGAVIVYVGRVAGVRSPASEEGEQVAGAERVTRELLDIRRRVLGASAVDTLTTTTRRCGRCTDCRAFWTAASTTPAPNG